MFGFGCHHYSAFGCHLFRSITIYYLLPCCGSSGKKKWHRFICVSASLKFSQPLQFRFVSIRACRFFVDIVSYRVTPSLCIIFLHLRARQREQLQLSSFCFGWNQTVIYQFQSDGGLTNAEMLQATSDNEFIPTRSTKILPKRKLQPCQILKT